MKTMFRTIVRIISGLFVKTAFANTPPKILIIGTGGTIAAAGKDSIVVEDLVAGVPGIDNFASLSFLQLFNISSSSITIENMLHLASAVSAALADDSINGVVITHGTDTMEETAYFLDLTVKSKKTVVITGSMRPANSLSADGPMNLFDAVATAACKDSAGKGVLLTLNGKIFDARNVTKTNTTAVDAFASPNFGPVGEIVAGRVNYFCQFSGKHTVSISFDINGMTDLPKVVILYDYAGSTSELLEKTIELGVKGIVYAGMGAGNINRASWELLAAAREKGIVIVRSSRTGSGSVAGNSHVSFYSKAELVSANNFNPQKARILLMLALTKTQDAKKIQEYFDSF